MCFEEGGKTQTSLRHDPQPRHWLRKIPAGDHALTPLLDPNHAQIHSSVHDPATTPAEGLFLADHIPGARYVELNAAHLSNVEDPDRFTQEVSGFLDS